jgi:hypothetical protein
MSLSDPSTVAETLASLMKEALSLRFQGELPGAQAGPLEVLESLLECRKKADRVEGLYLQALTIKGTLSRRSALHNAEAEDEWAEALIKVRNSPIYKQDSFAGPREKYAEADLATLEFKRQARKSAELLSLADEAVDVIRTTLTGLNNTRQDHISWIRSLQFMSTLEN